MSRLSSVSLRLSLGAGLSLAALLFASAAAAGTLGGAADDDISLARIAWVLALCLTLAVAGAFVLRHRLGQGPVFSFQPARPRRLKLIEQLRLGAHTSLSIVACDGRELLLVSSDKETRLLAQLPFDKAPP
jgi:flagellar biogenesis protein FliO